MVTKITMVLLSVPVKILGPSDRSEAKSVCQFWKYADFVVFLKLDADCHGYGFEFYDLWKLFIRKTMETK